MTFRALTVYGVQAELSPGTGLRPRARCGEGLASRAPHRCGAWMFWRRAVQGAVGTSKRIRPRVRGTTQSFRTHVVIAPSNWTAGGGARGREAGPPGRQSRATVCRRASGTRADLCARWSAAARHFRNRSATPRRSPGWRRLHVPPLRNGATRTSNW